MLRERVSENVYWFQSETYAQVTAGAVVGPQWAVVIDTLMPQDTITMRDYIENDLSVPVKYVINTHHHADHCWGNCFFPNATVIAHKLCRELMVEKSNPALVEAAKENPQFKNLKIITPHITFDEGSITLKVGKKQLRMFTTPGHSFDGISVLIEEDRVLFAGDAFMPVPFIVGGDVEILSETTRLISKMSLENIIQGHGDIILRGEIEESAKANLHYLKSIQKIVRASMRRRNPIEVLEDNDIESCGKNRVFLGGIANELHQRNLKFLYNRTLSGEIV
ncbi:MAG: MBL fold metallo-hydrolase [Anaerolineaceae bacterium]|nr:MBL fold metallo-hydrolase [Anaerolineaceae bacterium]